MTKRPYSLAKNACKKTGQQYIPPFLGKQLRLMTKRPYSLANNACKKTGQQYIPRFLGKQLRLQPPRPPTEELSARQDEVHHMEEYHDDTADPCQSTTRRDQHEEHEYHERADHPYKPLGDSCNVLVDGF
eukprot:CAMPEP_0204117504 /NCGR_PEP_ID=MMETSP0361-20130328/6013_1 /ASSEMBLY_ACC=CAM_ASM_000343 /TAXON_ID=268821 /ORGANISM="Scrippsiella Hangoei, Strain SHTV-5" /LENGTH=129 /DNA_ID=CAMNT_0051068409 /DNA_START=55 /DNA_END=447 /DNA_ORIENTATION=-